MKNLQDISTPSRTQYGDLAYSPFGIGLLGGISCGNSLAGSGPNDFAGHLARDARRSRAGARALRSPDTPDNLFDSPNRLLAPMMARWLSPDPAGLAAVNPADPETWNAYAYVGNQPLEFTDPLGLFKPGPYPDPCISPWALLDPSCELFGLGLQGAAELDQITAGGGPGGGSGAGARKITTAPPVGPGCSDALAAAGRGSSLAGVNLADQNWATLDAAAMGHGVPVPVLAAIAVYETGFVDRGQIGSGIGVGVFQNDSPPNPPVPFGNGLQADLPGQAKAAVSLLQTADMSLLRQGFSPVLAILGAIRDYNGGGWGLTPVLLEAGPQYLDLGTTGGDYATNVVGIAAACF